MQTFGDRVADKSVELIDVEIARAMEIVKIGNLGAIPNFDTYRYIIGQVHGLEVAKTFVKEAVEAVQQETRPDSQKVAA